MTTIRIKIKTAYLERLPECQVCNGMVSGFRTEVHKPATYDTVIRGGSQWGYLCEACFKIHGTPLLATRLATKEAK